jgi:Ca2+-binding EF-hand superfamily protein
VRLSEEELRIAMGAMDADGSGEVQFEELHAWIGHQVNGVSDGDDALVVEL